MTVLAAAPDWHDVDGWLPIIAAYVTAAPVGSACLRLSAGDDGPPADVVAEMLETSCAALAAGAPFGDVELTTEPPRSSDVLVRSASSVRAALGAPPPARPADPVEVADHAVAAKRLRDDVQAVLERRTFEAAGPLSRTGVPLVTVRIPTWGDVRGLLDVALPSVLGSTWPALEVLVCSDGPQPHARAAVEDVARRDPRVRYLELPERPAYPDHPFALWKVGGTEAINAALDEAKGEWIMPLDHDDAFTADHIPALVEAARRSGSDFVWGQSVCQTRRGTWELLGRPDVGKGAFCHGSVAYSGRLAHMRIDPDAWVLDEPGDWNMWRRIQATGARMTHLAHPVYVHFKEYSSVEHDERVAQEHMQGLVPTTMSPEELGRTVLASSARHLLDVALPARRPALV